MIVGMGTAVMYWRVIPREPGGLKPWKIRDFFFGRYNLWTSWNWITRFNYNFGVKPWTSCKLWISRLDTRNRIISHDVTKPNKIQHPSNQPFGAHVYIIQIAVHRDTVYQVTIYTKNTCQLGINILGASVPPLSDVWQSLVMFWVPKHRSCDILSYISGCI